MKHTHEKRDVDWHKDTGDKLKSVKDYLVRVYVEMANTKNMPTTATTEMRAVVDTLSGVKSKLEDVFGRDFPAEFSVNVYYGERKSLAELFRNAVN